MKKPSNRSFRAALGCVLGLAVSLVPGLAAPLAAEGPVEDFLDAADMTFTLEEADELTVYDVTTADGYTFKLGETEDGYTFTLDEARGPTQPQSGDWSRAFVPTVIDCSGRDEGGMSNLVAAVEPIINNFIGSADGGATARYGFTAPFGAEQLLGPLFDVLEMAEISSDVTYSTDGRDIHKAVGQLMQPSDFTVDFNLEFGVVGPCTILGTWHGVAVDSNDCSARGFVQWRNERCDL